MHNIQGHTELCIVFKSQFIAALISKQAENSDTIQYQICFNKT